MKVGFLFLLIFTSHSVFGAVCGKITRTKGKVEILRVKKASAQEESVRTALRGMKRMKLHCDDVVVTRKASRVKIRFKNKASMSLGPQSRLEVLEFVNRSKDQSLLKLTYGKVRALLKKKVPKKLPQKGAQIKSSGLVIKTASAVAGVRGTDFYMQYEPNSGVTEQATIEGSVEVEQVGSGEKVVVKKGHQVKVDNIKESSESSPVEDKPTAKTPAQTPPPKPLKVIPIEPQVVKEIRHTSSIVKDDPSFVTPEAVALLGPAKTWSPPPDEIPLDLKDIKEEF